MGGENGRFDEGLEGKLKARLFAAYVAYLTKQQQFEAVRAQLRPATVEVCENGPVHSAWINGSYFVDLCDTVGALFGAAEVRGMAKWATKKATFVVLRPILEGLVNLFGATPVTFFKRLDLGMQPLCKGFRAKFEATGNCGGEIVLASAYLTETAMTSEAWAAVFEEVIELSPFRGRVTVVRRAMRGPHSESRFAVSWEPRS